MIKSLPDKVNEQLPHHVHSQLPEHKLLAHMLYRAVMDLIGPKRRIAWRAEEWIMSKQSHRYPFSFRWVCLHLDFNPQVLQDRLLSLSDKDKALISARRMTDRRFHGASKLRGLLQDDLPLS